MRPGARERAVVFFRASGAMLERERADEQGGGAAVSAPCDAQDVCDVFVHGECPSGVHPVPVSSGWATQGGLCDARGGGPGGRGSWSHSSAVCRRRGAQAASWAA